MFLALTLAFSTACVDLDSEEDISTVESELQGGSTTATVTLKFQLDTPVNSEAILVEGGTAIRWFPRKTACSQRSSAGKACKAGGDSPLAPGTRLSTKIVRTGSDCECK